ncbi:nuclease-related domain-containing protein [Sporosarcina sp. FSL K6-2383]|uniref:nuclease-related domain-containing protein n=1 Tax=Sporosarcina sp. FSL K6-2383 TaxID=2921556 RepID=UPI00315AFE73
MNRRPPDDLISLERLLARLPQNHGKYQTISQKLYQAKAGYAGELIIDRILNEITFPKGTIIIKDLTLEINPNFLVQLDTLILTPTSIILLEIKNYSGTVLFDEASGKTTKISPGDEIEKYDCIIHQLDRATEAIRGYLRKRHINLPINPILVMANQRTEIPVFPETVPLKFTKQLPRYIRTLIGNTDAITTQQVTAVSNQLRAAQVKWKRIPACEKHTISATELKQGVLCLDCSAIMSRMRGRTWICNSCGKSSEGALEQSIADWYLLISPTLTNKQLRHFLKLNSNSAASIIFRQLRLHRKGNPPGTLYTWDYKLPLHK